MIALRDELPLVQFGDGQIAAFEPEWLVRRVSEAAHKAGYSQWWLAEHVAKSVATYLRQRFAGNVVTLPRLAGAVQSILQVIGYGEVANYFEAGPPPIKISLLELARNAGSGYELAFFELLGRTVNRVLATEATYFELVELERCVKKLRSKKIWSRDCQSLRTEIITFLREQIEQAGTSGALGDPKRNLVFSVV